MNGETLIPDRINDVAVEFASGVDRRVEQSLIDLLLAFIQSQVAPPFILRTLHISSAADGHQLPSRHAMRRAVDMSRINGKQTSVHYPNDPEVRAITDTLIQRAQICGPTFVAREVFGPGPGSGVKLKLGQPFPQVKDHQDHIHLSEEDKPAYAVCPWSALDGVRV